MIPIHKLLSRIRWDAEFGQGTFEIGYYDRIVNAIIRVPLSEVVFKPVDKHTVQVMDEDGLVHTVPLHRIREVYRDNTLIWQRGGEGTADNGL